MTANHAAHLSDEALTELLLGDRSTKGEAHFRACAACRMEAARMAGGLHGFQAASLAWAQGRVQAGLRAPAPARKASRLGWRAAAVSLAAVAVAAGVGGGVHQIGEARRVAQRQAAGAGSVAEENRRLLAIDKELSVQEPSPRVLYKLPAGKAEQE